MVEDRSCNRASDGIPRPTPGLGSRRGSEDETSRPKLADACEKRAAVLVTNPYTWPPNRRPSSTARNGRYGIGLDLVRGDRSLVYIEQVNRPAKEGEKDSAPTRGWTAWEQIDGAVDAKLTRKRFEPVVQMDRRNTRRLEEQEDVNATPTARCGHVRSYPSLVEYVEENDGIWMTVGRFFAVRIKIKAAPPTTTVTQGREHADTPDSSKVTFHQPRQGRGRYSEGANLAPSVFDNDRVTT